MKVKVINRSEEDFTRERSNDVKKVHRNYDPDLHQFSKAHEYARALNAAKLDRVFAKPFVAALPHADGVTALARNPRRLNSLVAGSADGVIMIWDIPGSRPLRKLLGHSGAVRGIGFAPGGEACVSAGADASAKLWKVRAGCEALTSGGRSGLALFGAPQGGGRLAARPQAGNRSHPLHHLVTVFETAAASNPPQVPYAPFEAGDVCAEQGPALEFSGRHAFRGVDHHWCRPTFATAGSTVELWDHGRSEAVGSFSWGSDSVVSVRFNPVSNGEAAAAGRFVGPSMLCALPFLRCPIWP